MPPAFREPVYRSPLVQWGVIVTVAAQVIVIVWMAGAANQRLTQLEEDVKAAADLPGRVIRLETRWEAIERSLSDLGVKLDMILQRQARGSP